MIDDLALTTHQITLLVGPASILPPLFEGIAQFALRSPLVVLDGGNTFQGYALARALYRRAPQNEAAAALRRVLLARVFTCYQMTTLLSEAALPIQPTLVLDFLSTFYDQSVRAAERQRLLTLCIRRLQILSRQAPVAVWVRQRLVIPEDAVQFLGLLQQAAGETWQPERLPAPAHTQPSLFPL